LVAVACFLPVRAKDLPAPPRMRRILQTKINHYGHVVSKVHTWKKSYSVAMFEFLAHNSHTSNCRLWFTKPFSITGTSIHCVFAVPFAQTGGWTNISLIPCGDKRSMFLPEHLVWLWGSSSLMIGTGAVSLGVKYWGYEADHLLLTTVNVLERLDLYLYCPSAHVLMACKGTLLTFTFTHSNTHIIEKWYTLILSYTF